MICPVCRDEYRKGFTRCATCSVDLVETLDVAAPVVPPHPVAAAVASGVTPGGGTNVSALANALNSPSSACRRSTPDSFGM